MRFKKGEPVINRKEYTDRLLGFLTDKEIGQFKVIFPKSPTTDRNKDGAIDLVERHLKEHRNSRVQQEKHTEEVKELSVEIAVLKGERSAFRNKNHLDSVENSRLAGEIDRLSSAENIDKANTLRRLAILDALEAGGVDNWEWYEESLKNADL